MYEAMLYQLYKGKGEKDDLQNSHFIHLKGWLPRTCDAMMVDMMKPVILDKSTIVQIGGQQFRRTLEHLFTLRSCITMVMGGGDDISAICYSEVDKENVRDVMDFLHKIGIEDKLYRSWFSLNRNTCIKVNTLVGMSERAKVGEVV